jgi:hypothetical protein
VTWSRSLLSSIACMVTVLMGGVSAHVIKVFQGDGIAFLPAVIFRIGCIPLGVVGDNHDQHTDTRRFVAANSRPWV